MAHPLRAATIPDAPVLAALHAGCFDKAWDAAAFATFLADPASLCLLATDDGAPPMGFVLARQAADEAEILTLAVAPEHRRRGVGRALMGAAQDALAERGVRRLFLEVGAGNEAATTLYVGLGFTIAGRRAGYYRQPGQEAGGDALLMARDLVPR